MFNHHANHCNYYTIVIVYSTYVSPKQLYSSTHTMFCHIFNMHRLLMIWHNDAKIYVNASCEIRIQSIIDIISVTVLTERNAY